jgi:O-phospho-L-seryl-tRNASec:L-selenocysteinyl-tRNA synthase
MEPKREEQNKIIEKKEESKKEIKLNNKEKGKEKDIIESFIGKSYNQIGKELMSSHENIFQNILNTRSIPDEPLNQNTINYILNYISNMDSNNGPYHIGIGEREGRIISNLVNQRNYGLVHGIGRSGNISDLQPKACGSSLLVQLTNSLLKNLLKSIGMSFIKDIIILPFATGMALTLSYLTLRLLKPKAKYIIWSRIDQKTCLKCIITSGFEPLIINPIPNKKNDYEIETDIEQIKTVIDKYGVDNILCITSTTSCFAPRCYDNIEEISKICYEKKIFHVINNAYGIYCTKIIDLLNKADKIGDISLIVSSTDKNFMVPVGGSFIYSSNEDLVQKIKKNYPGRASISPIIDLFITFLEMGKNKYKALIKERKEKYDILIKKMEKVAIKFGEKIIAMNGNKISILFTLKNIVEKSGNKDAKEIGSMCFNRQISGVRIITSSKGEKKNIGGYDFLNYGSSCDDYKYLPYMTFSCAIGIKDEEIDGFVNKIDKIFENFIKH